MEGLSTDFFSSLVTKNPDEFLPLIYDESGNSRCLYFQKLFKYEKRLGTLLEGFLSKQSTFSPENFPGIIKDILLKNPLNQVETGKPLELNQEQMTALGIGLLQSFSIISGGPGTGKTFIVLNLLRCLLRLGISKDRIFLAAPTGLAAQRLNDSIKKGLRTIDPLPEIDEELLELEGQTIHRLLKYSKWKDQFNYNRENPLPAEVVIIDEVSMVNMVLMAKLVEAIPSEAKVIFLGDKDQLPSVEAGTVLADLIPPLQKTLIDGKTKEKLKTFLDLEFEETKEKSPLVNRVVVLKESFRSQKSILDVAEKINQGDISFIEEIWGNSQIKNNFTVDDLKNNDGVNILERETDDLDFSMIDSWAKAIYLGKTEGGQSSYKNLVKKPIDLDSVKNSAGHLDLIFHVIEDARILTVTRNGFFGVEGINQKIENTILPELDPSAKGKWFAGKIVMVTKNDYDKELFNGEVGVVLRSKKGSYKVVFKKSEGYVSYSLDSPPNVESAFAITVHKSQGSEFAKLLMILPQDTDHRLLSREILYTGLTRAKNLAVICSSKEAFKKAIETKINRISGLDIW